MNIIADMAQEKGVSVADFNRMILELALHLGLHAVQKCDGDTEDIFSGTLDNGDRITLSASLTKTKE